MRTILDAAHLHDTDEHGRWTVTVGGIHCGRVYQRGNGLRFQAVALDGETRGFQDRETAAEWLAQQEVGR